MKEAWKSIEGKEKRVAPPQANLFVPPNILKIGILLVLSLSFLISCTGLRPSGHLIKPITSSSEILRKVEMRQRTINDLKGIAKMKVINVERKYSFKEVIIARRPSSLRMETLGVFGQPLLFLTARDGRLSILSLKENTFYQGEVTPENLSIFFPVSLRSKDLFPLLLGGVSFVDYIGIDSEFLGKENLYLVKQLGRGGAARQLLWIEPFNFTVVKSEAYDLSGNLVFRVKFDEFTKLNGHLFPMSTNIQLPLSSTAIKIDYSDLEVNTGVSESSFNLVIPPGAKVVNMD